MTTSSLENPTPNEPPDILVDTGNELREARIKAGLSEQDVAQRLRLDPDTIRYLEEESYDRLPAPAFVRGYLRNYASVLGIPPDPLIRAFNRRGLPAPPLRADLAQSPTVTAIRNPIRIAITGVLLCAVIVIAVHLHGETPPADNTEAPSADRSEPSSSEPTAPSARAPSAPEHTASTTLLLETATHSPAGHATVGLTSPPSRMAKASEGAEGPSEDLLPKNQGFQIGANAPSVSPPPSTDNPVLSAPTVAESPTLPAVAQTEVSPSVAEAEAVTNSQASPQDRLAMRFVHDSWVEIYDEQGTRLHYSLMKAGEALALTGVAPFRVLLGYAKDVEIEYNGKVFDHRSFIHPQGLARFSLGKRSETSAAGGGNDGDPLVPTSGDARSVVDPSAVTAP